jgi:hypothetical protein
MAAGHFIYLMSYSISDFRFQISDLLYRFALPAMPLFRMT